MNELSPKPAALVNGLFFATPDFLHALAPLPQRSTYLSFHFAELVRGKCDSCLFGSDSTTGGDETSG